MSTPNPSRARQVLARLASVWAAIAVDDVVLVLALLLIAAGFWLVWKPGAFIVPGVVLLWLVLPSRAPFVTRPPAAKKPAPQAPDPRRTA